MYGFCYEIPAHSVWLCFLPEQIVNIKRCDNPYPGMRHPDRHNVIGTGNEYELLLCSSQVPVLQEVENQFFKTVPID